MSAYRYSHCQTCDREVRRLPGVTVCPKCGKALPPAKVKKWPIAIEAIRKAAPGVGEEIDESEICIACWRADPAAFGMRGHNQYPDTKTVHVLIHLMIKKGLLIRTRARTYLVVQAREREQEQTDAGVHRVFERSALRRVDRKALKEDLKCN